VAGPNALCFLTDAAIDDTPLFPAPILWIPQKISFYCFIARNFGQIGGVGRTPDALCTPKTGVGRSKHLPGK
jgi:hypothetical protein